MNLHESKIAVTDAGRPSSWLAMFGTAFYAQRPDLPGQFLANFQVLGRLGSGTARPLWA
jgi:hypothetical protein